MNKTTCKFNPLFQYKIPYYNFAFKALKKYIYRNVYKDALTFLCRIVLSSAERETRLPAATRTNFQSMKTLHRAKNILRALLCVLPKTLISFTPVQNAFFHEKSPRKTSTRDQGNPSGQHIHPRTKIPGRLHTEKKKNSRRCLRRAGTPG